MPVTVNNTQEALANAAHFSLPHIGHIETGKTKLSLTALVNIANVLDTTPDALLYDNVQLSVDSYDKEFKDLIMNCTPHEKSVLLEMLKQLITTMHNKNVLKESPISRKLYCECLIHI